MENQDLQKLFKSQEKYERYNTFIARVQENATYFHDNLPSIILDTLYVRFNCSNDRINSVPFNRILNVIKSNQLGDKIIKFLKVTLQLPIKKDKDYGFFLAELKSFYEKKTLFKTLRDEKFFEQDQFWSKFNEFQEKKEAKKEVKEPTLDEYKTNLFRYLNKLENKVGRDFIMEALSEYEVKES